MKSETQASTGDAMVLRANANLLQFLERHAPRELAAIRHDDDENYDLLHVKAVFDAASHGAVPADTVLTAGTRKSVLGLTASYATTLAPVTKLLVRAIDQRLRRCQVAKMLGGVVAVVSGAILALVPALGYDRAAVALWSAASSCAGGLLTLAASALERSPNGLRVSASDYQALVNYGAELAGIERRLGADDAFRITDQALVKLYNRANEIADEMARFQP